MSEPLEKRLRAACVGHPYAKISWPHGLLHEAADALLEIESDEGHEGDMLPASLIAWRERLNWSAAEAARQLGLARNTYMAYEKGRKIPLSVAYACAAIAHGLPPMK